MRKPHDYDKRLEGIRREEERPRSAFDLWRSMGAHARKLDQRKGAVAVDSMLAAYRNRMTYTFILGKEVASIHFDKEKREIFFKGHNLNNMALSEDQKEALFELTEILEKDPQGKKFVEDYKNVLHKCLAEKR
ncbi:hypothetical protein KKA47_02930 [bacterium]|nr:hypothetical protein [bacterium]